MSMVSEIVRSAGAAALVMACLACSGGADDSNEELGQGSPPVPGDSAVLTTTEPAQLDDPSIAAILAAADTAEIAPSALAESQAQDEEVRQFASLMVREHGMLSDSLRALTSAQGITPMPNRESEVIETQTAATLQALENLSGTAFDSVYVAAMVQSHEAALNLIDDQLLPAVNDARLRRAIEEQVRPRVAAHLEQVQQIRMTLSLP